MARDRASEGDGLLGKELGGYTIESRLGSGATGVVYRARHPELPRPVAVKVLNENLGHISALRRRFEREARALAKLKHPHVVHITDFGVENDITFIAMELLEGETLEDLLQRAPMDPVRAVGVTLQTLRGLAFAHENGIVHRDLKPANIFLRQVAGGIDVVKVLDFGLAKFLTVDELSQEATLTRKGRIVGTPAYMAPEQITGVSLDVRADVYAMGIVLYEMLADQRPFHYDRRSQLLRAHLFEPVPSMTRLRPGLSVAKSLERLVLTALEKDPAMRYANAAEMLAAVEDLPEEPAGFSEGVADGLRSRTGSSAAVVISEAERLAVTTGLDERLDDDDNDDDDDDLDDTGSMSIETVQVQLDAESRRDRPLTPTLETAATGVRRRGGSLPTTSSHPRPRANQDGPPRWMWVLTGVALLGACAAYLWSLFR